ncbi:hypothetical protein AMATHDRAFT_64448 [Amanita thiersii Skay4041]|uniref:CENP-V/GFA domain-containing protein n=1 Tax=Amanita thiersii Skay4041 TaxID=703135 RepID=A0A2A9NMA5_9AGAR|nr:hypothetical protein AMATHDRAFT_64448 [Amanita thiersii Skay4041]
MPYEGTCLCKSTKITVDAEPKASYLCHCNDCKQASGAAFSHLISVPAAATKLEGPIGTFTVIALSGNKVTRTFCTGCGSQLIGRSNAVGDDDIGVYLGNIPALSHLPITMEFYTRDRVAGLPIVPGAKQVLTQ